MADLVSVEAILMPETQPPEFLSSRYQILSLLGEGGMGSVYRAHDPMLDKEVAIKVLSQAMTKQGAIRFQNEARATGALNHNNIVRILDFGVTEDLKPYMVMEFLDGDDLGTLIKRERTNIPIELLVKFFIGICEGIEHAHQRKILHRDIKPSNVIVRRTDEGYQVSIVDFGIAKLTQDSHRLTVAGDVLGSPYYMSPEQAEGQDVDERSDIYSIGCVMYEALSWQPPFKGDTLLETLSMHRFEPPRPFSEAAPREIPEWLEDVVVKCLGKERTERYQTVSELRRALEQGAGSGLPSLRIDHAEQVSSHSTSAKWIWGVVSLMVCVGIAAGTMVFAGSSDTRLQDDVVKRERKNTKVNKLGLGAIHEQTTARADSHYIPDALNLTESKFKFERAGDGMKLTAQLANDEDMRICNQYPDAEIVDFKYSEIDGHGFKFLKLPRVVAVRIGASPLKDENLKYLKRLKSLIKLELSHITTLNGSGLHALPGLIRLEITDSQLTKEMMDAIGSLSSLKVLCLKRGTGLTETNISSIVKLRNLAELYLEDIELTDAMLAKLKTVPAYRLGLRRNHHLTAASLETLREMPNLELIHLELCEGINEAQRYKLATIMNGVYVPTTNWIMPRNYSGPKP